MAPELLENEEIVGSWTLNFRPDENSRYTGKIYVTNQRILFDARHDNSSLLTAIADSYNSVFGTNGWLRVDLERIDRVEMRKSFFKKQFILWLVDETALVFDYGMMSVNKIVAAINDQLASVKAA